MFLSIISKNFWLILLNHLWLLKSELLGRLPTTFFIISEERFSNSGRKCMFLIFAFPNLFWKIFSDCFFTLFQSECHLRLGISLDAFTALVLLIYEVAFYSSWKPIAQFSNVVYFDGSYIKKRGFEYFEKSYRYASIISAFVFL